LSGVGFAYIIKGGGDRFDITESWKDSRKLGYVDATYGGTDSEQLIEEEVK
jgi:hypothetical protein